MSLPQLTSHDYRDVIGRFASGVTVITATADGRPVGTTASAVTSLSIDPPKILACLDKTSVTGAAILDAGRFAVNILGEEHADLARRFATKGPDKFDGVPLVEGDTGVPLLEGALATLECRVVEQVSGGTHWVFMAEVERASAREGAPLAYFRGLFGRLEQHDERKPEMSDPVYKTVEITGTSTTNVNDAIQAAVAKASETLRNLDWFEVVNVRGAIDNG
ncbi:MAG: 4-nitrophenol 2-monooxygenase / 4-nitrocatechol 4-monooxygenase, reductase component, partial [Solirubrobacteraceae bacterium]|nr:4-nitrophenol 2-monooxygenase / 4-nitrocatechol 4-monooxygenase, reductase component [Solirubrobacteraceae bacterium]